jgi:hypothetical protein
LQRPPFLDGKIILHQAADKPTLKRVWLKKSSGDEGKAERSKTLTSELFSFFVQFDRSVAFLCPFLRELKLAKDDFALTALPCDAVCV